MKKLSSILEQNAPKASLQRRIDKANAAIAQAAKDDVWAVETDSTWENEIVHHPIEVKGDWITFKYEDKSEFNRKKAEKKERYKWNSVDGMHDEDISYMLSWIVKTIKKGYREEGKTVPKF